MNKGELINLISKRTQLHPSYCEKVLGEAKNVLIEVLNKGGEVVLRNFGKFGTKETSQRLYRNPITRRQFYSTPKKQITFQLFKNFKYSIK